MAGVLRCGRVSREMGRGLGWSFLQNIPDSLSIRMPGTGVQLPAKHPRFFGIWITEAGVTLPGHPRFFGIWMPGAGAKLPPEYCPRVFTHSGRSFVMTHHSFNVTCVISIDVENHTAAFLSVDGSGETSVLRAWKKTPVAIMTRVTRSVVLLALSFFVAVSF